MNNNTLGLLAGRVLLAKMFLLSGISKINAYAGAGAYMESVGVPSLLLPLVIGLEIGGALALIAGWQTRLVSYALASFTLAAAILFHFLPADQMQMILFLKNIAIVGGFLVLAASGAGAWSLDARRQKTSA